MVSTNTRKKTKGSEEKHEATSEEVLEKAEIVEEKSGKKKGVESKKARAATSKKQTPKKKTKTAKSSTKSKAKKKTKESKEKVAVEVLKHFLVPEMRVLSKKEESALFKKYGIDVNHLPKILDVDPSVVALKAKEGDVIEIKRQDATGTYLYYRLVISSAVD